MEGKEYCVWEDIPAKGLSHNSPSVESFFTEIIFHKKKWLMNCSYNPNNDNIKIHLGTISRTLDAFPPKHKNVLFLGDFSACVDDETLNKFCSSYCLKSLIKQPTSFKSSKNPRYIGYNPRFISCRDFKKFENERVMDSLDLALNSQNTDYTTNPDLFFNICQNKLNHHAPRKKRKFVRIITLS